MPLYYYYNDLNPGDVNGQGIGGAWFVAQPNMTGFPSPAIPANNTVANSTNAAMNGTAANASANGTALYVPIYGAAPIPIAQVYQSQSSGPILADSNGMALYVFENDAASHFSCTGSCAAVWPPLIYSSNYTTNVPGLNVSEMMRPDGTYQATYNGMLLYTYSNDTQPGVATGDGIGGLWHVVLANLTGYPSK